MSWAQLNSAVSKCNNFFYEIGIKPNDRIAFYLPNLPETVVLVLAAASIGAVCSFVHLILVYRSFRSFWAN